MWSYLSRAYLDLQQLRIACQARLRKMREQGVPEEVCTLIMEDYYLTLKEEEKTLLARITERLKGHPLYEWASIVKGMGPVAALVYLGFLDAKKADTAGKARAYVGAVPGKGLKAGQKVRFNPLAKGRGKPEAPVAPQNVADHAEHNYGEGLVLLPLILGEI